ncbi:MAG: GNAT family N-acetyltransferase [Elainella sp.]
MSTELSTRQATPADIPFLARIEYEACLPPDGHCFWDELLVDTGTATLDFIAAKLKADASNWGRVEEFLILEEQGQPIAAAAGYCPNGADYRPLKLSALEQLAQELGWSSQTRQQFYERYEQFWQLDPQMTYLQPQAPWLIETVAVLPEGRGRGLGKALLRAMLDWGRSQHHSHAGIMIINGNEAARRTYESVGFKPYQTFYSDYFDDTFVGITKFRCCL